MSRPVIVGAGAAGLMAALCLARHREVLLLCGGSFGAQAASGWAQGGIAAAIGADDDIALHMTDTLNAGAGMCDPAAVQRIIAAGPWAIETLQALGAQFDHNENGKIALGLEAAHSRRRIVHAKDATGAEIMRALTKAVRRMPNIAIIEHATVSHLFVDDNIVQGLRYEDAAGSHEMQTAAMILATGGVGGLFADTTNPLSAVGSGLALAARAGATLRDMEFVQFHPTALACGLDPMPLVSEAVRGEGAVFVDAAGAAFMAGADLAPRDVVARAVAAKYADGSKVFLDARAVPAEKFPAIFELCRTQGIDPVRQPIPIAPAAHYHMGGIAVDAACESSVSGLFACGEVAATGLHGANRLASNSLLEAIVTGRDAAAAITAREASEREASRPTQIFQPSSHSVNTLPAKSTALATIRFLCSQHLGIVRTETGLRIAIATLEPLAPHDDAALVALLMAKAALARRESRGAHLRSDFPEALPRQAGTILKVAA